MRCARVHSLLDRLLDGALEADLAGRVSAHVAACRRCQESLAAARRLADGLASQPLTRAPRGFAERVMREVSRQALTPEPVPAAVSAEREAQRIRFYRRLGLSFMLSAGLLAVSLLIPRASYPTLIGSRVASAELSAGGPSVVRSVLAGAGRAVQGALGETSAARSGNEGGSTR